MYIYDKTWLGYSYDGKIFREIQNIHSIFHDSFFFQNRGVYEVT